MKILNEELYQVLLFATDEELAALYKQYDEHLTFLLNDPSATEEQINTVADKILVLSMSVDTSNHQPMELNSEFSNSPPSH